MDWLQRRLMLKALPGDQPSIQLVPQLGVAQPLSGKGAVSLSPPTPRKYQTIALSKQVYEDGEFRSPGYLFVHESNFVLQWSTTVLGVPVTEQALQTIAASIEAFQSEIKVKRVTGSVSYTLPPHLKDKKELFARLNTIYDDYPQEMKERISKDEWLEQALENG